MWDGGLQTEVHKASDSKLDVVTKIDGETAMDAQFLFSPQDGGKATLVEADVNVDQPVMRKALAGTGHEQVAELPRFAFARGMQRLLAK